MPAASRSVRLEGRDIAVEGADGAEHQCALGEITGIGDEVAGFRVVGAVGDDVVAADDGRGVVGVETRLYRLHGDMRIESASHVPRAEHLRFADMVGVVGDLALQVVERDAVVVDDADGADAGRGEIQDQRRAETAGAHDEHARAFQFLLALAADLLQHEMALVALDLRRRQARRVVVLHPITVPQLAPHVSGRRRLAHMLVNALMPGQRKRPGADKTPGPLIAVRGATA